MIIKRVALSDDNAQESWDISSGMFSASAWTKIYDHRLIKFQIVSDSGKNLGGFVAFEGGRSYAKTLITPPFAPNIGLFFKSEKTNPALELSARKQVAQAIAAFLKSSEYVYYKLDFPVEWTDMQPYVWSGMTVSPRYTYRLNLEEKGNSWLDDADPKLRNMIEKGKREGLDVVIREQGDGDILRSTMASLNDKGVKYDEEILKNLVLYSGANILQVTKDHHVIYSGIFLLNESSAYYLLANYDKDAGSNAISAFGLYSIIQYCIDKKCPLFDFEGSMIPGVEKFFRSFGGVLTPYYSVSGGKSFWPWLMRLRQKNGR